MFFQVIDKDGDLVVVDTQAKERYILMSLKEAEEQMKDLYDMEVNTLMSEYEISQEESMAWIERRAKDNAEKDDDLPF